MMESNEKLTWREKLSLNKRAAAIWYKAYPALFVSTALYSLVKAALPYVTLWFSAQILNELADGRRRAVLIHNVLLLLILSAAGMLIKAALHRWSNISSDGTGRLLYEGSRYFEKMLSMDYCVAEETATHEQLNTIEQVAQWGGWGLKRIYTQFQELLEALFQLLGGIGLSVSLFRLPVRADMGRLRLLDSPFCVLPLALLTVGATVLSPWLGAAGTRYWLRFNDDCRLGNRFFGFCGKLVQEEKRALDVRLYRQDRVGAKLNKINDIYGIHSKLAECARGPMGLAQAASEAVSGLFMGIVWLFVCLKAWGGAFGVGSVTQYIGAVTALSGGLAALLRVISEAGINAAYLKQALSFLDIPNRMYQGSLTVEKRSDRNYEVEFRNVSFRYPNAERYALRNVSLKFKVGERLALVGQNGSGKTTFIKLLCRLYDPTEGEILLNGIDIRKYDYQEYIHIFSVVFQDFRLLSLSVGQNVAARGVYDARKVESCCEKAGIWARVAVMEKGPDTALYKDLSEEGVQISGGEEQKLAIARALYRDSAFLILDEPTAALDPMAEYELYTRLNEIVEDKTAIYISHRLSSCRFCDEIIVFHEGRMVQQGSHETLLAQQEGKYSELWNAQAQYYVTVP
ncbi:MAG: ABC transporter ATP-binding protein/permease [Roseburia sp.]|nr:ABC transporter ATP-binding protein/permease [Roseburia sp.]